MTTCRYILGLGRPARPPSALRLTESHTAHHGNGFRRRLAASVLQVEPQTTAMEEHQARRTGVL